ncbi:MAG: hypothetical protein HY833_00065 [Candidatus Aenigmarchaeota archaeon]|nr:hypothetical protein [Candidatus Aenigmarchaeota archaeon]
MAYYGRQPSEVEIDSHYAMLNMLIEDGMKMKMPIIEIMLSVDAGLRELRAKNYMLARETGIRMNMRYPRTFYPFKFRT